RRLRLYCKQTFLASFGASSLMIVATSVSSLFKREKLSTELPGKAQEKKQEIKHLPDRTAVTSLQDLFSLTNSTSAPEFGKTSSVESVFH
ncbi:MAG: hypothetical protein JRN15_11730, partial [Nitrososphaerota archaeon]|nr:hypothetical protein [Nitrososphaerota archaeon]